MSKKVTQRRPGNAEVILVLLLFAGVGLGWWVQRSNWDASRRTAELDVYRDRVFASVMTMIDGLQGLLIDPKSEPARKRLRDGQAELSAAADGLQARFADIPEAPSAAKNLIALYGPVVAQVDSDVASALVDYRKRYTGIQERREELLNQLSREIEMMIGVEAANERIRDTSAMVCIGLILTASLVVLWLHSIAAAKPLASLSDMLDRMRKGDFTQRVALEGSDSFNGLGEGLNLLAQDLSQLVRRVKESGIEVTASADRIGTTSRHQQSTVVKISTTTSEIESASRRISSTSRDLVRTIDEVSQVARDAGQLANSGQSGISRMESTMRQIMEASTVITGKLAVLSEKTANINSVVTTITKVADQTNLLSLNAAIEAEKAGEYGLGFAIVAMEIRRLADQTGVATYDIEKSVKEMQSAVASSVMGLDQFSEEVRHGVEEIRQVGSQLGQIIHQVQTLPPRFQAVNEGMHGQASGAQQISDTLSQLGDAARQTAEALRESSLAIERLNHAAQGLQSSVEWFKLER